MAGWYVANLDALQENSMSSRWAYCIPIKILQMIAEKMCICIYIYVCVYVCVFREKLRKHTSTTLHQLVFEVTPGFTKPQVFFLTGNDHKS